MSPSTGRSYPLTLVCAAWRVPRSSVYALRSAPGGECKPGKRGPKTELSDEALVVEIRTVLSRVRSWARGTGRVGRAWLPRGSPRASASQKTGTTTIMTPGDSPRTAQGRNYPTGLDVVR